MEGMTYMKQEIKNVVFLDVRNTWEYKEKHLENSILIPFNKLSDDLEKTLKNKNTPIVIFCSTGTRSKVAEEYIIEKGYTNIIGTVTVEEAEIMQKNYLMEKAKL